MLANQDGAVRQHRLITKYGVVFGRPVLFFVIYRCQHQRTEHFQQRLDRSGRRLRAGGQSNHHCPGERRFQFHHSQYPGKRDHQLQPRHE